jgi:hypothetical protein
VAWVNVIGLACDIAGTIVLSLGLILSEDEALKLGTGPGLLPDTRRPARLASEGA